MLFVLIKTQQLFPNISKANLAVPRHLRLSAEIIFHSAAASCVCVCVFFPRNPQNPNVVNNEESSVTPPGSPLMIYGSRN